MIMTAVLTVGALTGCSPGAKDAGSAASGKGRYVEKDMELPLGEDEIAVNFTRSGEGNPLLFSSDAEQVFRYEYKEDSWEKAELSWTKELMADGAASIVGVEETGDGTQYVLTMDNETLMSTLTRREAGAAEGTPGEQVDIPYMQEETEFGYPYVNGMFVDEAGHIWLGDILQVTVVDGETRETLLELPAPAALASLEKIGNDPDYLRFCDENDYWLTPYATFRAAKELLGGMPWQEWPEPYRTYSPRLAGDPKLRQAIEGHRRLQYKFQCEWDALLDYAHERGIKIIGDMPMYVSVDSADVWSEPDIFDLDESGYPRRQAGAPGDAFAPEGQVWGNPTYRWDILREQNYNWWLRRFSRALKLYDVVRLDHFIGFSSYFAVPAGKGAADGAYAFGPGVELFEIARRQFGPLPFIAEDLGAITPAVRGLVAATGIPGMDVVQFADSDVRESYDPQPGAVVYTGTHDNQTLVGFCESRYGMEREDAVEMADAIARRALATDANVAVMPLQDVLQLGDEARMNVPGVAGGWRWYAPDDLVAASAERLADLAEKSGRILG